jgi:hypothetical protein
MVIATNKKTKVKKTVTPNQKLQLLDYIKKIPFISCVEQQEVFATFELPVELLGNRDARTIISKALVLEAIAYGLNIVTDQYYMSHLFEFVYFSEAELLLGHTQRPKHCVLQQFINYYIDVIIENNQVKLLVVNNDLEPQILSNPTDWLARVRHLKSLRVQSV